MYPDPCYRRHAYGAPSLPAPYGMVATAYVQSCTAPHQRVRHRPLTTTGDQLHQPNQPRPPSLPFVHESETRTPSIKSTIQFYHRDRLKWHQNLCPRLFLRTQESFRGQFDIAEPACHPTNYSATVSTRTLILHTTGPERPRLRCEFEPSSRIQFYKSHWRIAATDSSVSVYLKLF